MTCNEILTAMTSRGAKTYTPPSQNQITLLNASLRQHRFALLPAFMNDLYKCVGGLNLDTGYIFGPSEIIRQNATPIPDILTINKDISTYKKISGMTIFGRNDLFWFAYDAFGICYMLDNLTLKPLRKYDNPYRAITDCLIAGKV